MPLISPAKIEYDPFPIYEGKCCCFTCCEAGKIKIRLQLGRRAYSPGEKVNLSGSYLDNDSTIPVNVRVVLRQMNQLSTTGTFETTETGIDRIELASEEVEPQSSTSLENLLVTIPAVPPSFFGARGLEDALREPLLFTYVLSLQGKATSGHKVKVDMPILISALPPKSDAIHEAVNKTSHQIPITDPFQLQHLSVTDDSPCDTVPVMTGLDGALVVPSVTGTCNLWEKEEDTGNPADAFLYEPQVVVFPALTNN